jgi:MFS transporter, ACS family, glucarate transporter
MQNPYIPAKQATRRSVDVNRQADRSGRRAVVFALAASTSFLLYLHRYTWNLVRPELEAQYGLSNTQLEALGSMFFFPYALGQVPGGILCDLFGPHIFLVVIILAWSILLPLHGLTGNFWALLAVRAGFGFSQAGCYPALSQVTRAWFPLERRTQVQGWIASAFGRGGGAMASIIMGSLLMGYWGVGWIGSLFILSIVGIVFALLFLTFFRNSPEDGLGSSTTLSDHQVSESDATQVARVLPFRIALTNRSYVILLIQQFLNAGSDVVFVLILGSYLKSLGVQSGGSLGFLVSLPLWGGAAGGIFGGYANDWAIRRFKNRRWCRSLIAGFGLGIGGLLVVLAVGSTEPLTVAIGLMIARFFTDWNQPTVWGTCTDLGGRFSATVFGLNNMTGNMGAFLTPFAVGGLLDYFSVFIIVDGQSVRQTNYVPAFVMCAGMMWAAAACWLMIDCTKTIVPETDDT